MNASTRTDTRIVTITLACAAMLVGCLPAGGIDIGEDEQLEGWGLRIDEAAMEATLETGAVYVDIPLVRTEEDPPPMDVTVEVAIVSLDGEMFGLSRVGARVEDGSTTVSLEVPGLPEDLFDGTLADYNLSFSVETPGGQLYGRRSLFSVVKRVSTVVVGSDSLVAGGQGSLRVTALDGDGDTPVADARVEVDFMPEEGPSVELFRGSTDEFGISRIWFPVLPSLAGTGDLAVRVYHEQGSNESRHAVTVAEQRRILVTTDKPLYQPGQTIHIRALVMDDARRTPAAHQDVLVEVRDGKGNKVRREELRTNGFGVASTTFKLARLVNMGRYTIDVFQGDTKQTKTVTVDRYALPKFDADLTMDRPYYLPGQTVHGSLEAIYTFGQPVSRADVQVRLYQYVGDWDLYSTADGETDDDGAFQYDVDLPTYLVGLPLEQGGSLMRMEVQVTDGAGSTRTMEQSIIVSQDSVVLQVIPERYSLVPGLKNHVWIVSTSPVGSPLALTMNVSANAAEPVEVTTGEMGFAAFSFTPLAGSNSLTLTGVDETGAGFAETVYLNTEGGGDDVVLLRTDAALYEVGDTMELSVTVPRATDRVYLDMVRDGQTVLEQILDVEDHLASASVDVSDDMTGTLVASVYYISDDGRIVRDQRIVYVQSASALLLDFATDREVYRPAETARLDVQVRDAQGRPVQAAVGINVVDEAVFALSEMKPGMEQTYFDLEEQIRQPTVTVYGYSVQDLFTGGGVDTEDESTQQVAKMLFAAASGDDVFGIYYSSRLQLIPQMMAVAETAVDRDLGTITEALETYLASRSDDLFGTPSAAGWVDARRDSWFDPWGKRYEASLDGSRLILRSAGVDEVWSTDDDIEASGWVDLDAGRSGDELNGDTDDGWEGGDPTGAADAAADTSAPPDPGPEEEGEADAPRVREYFPETLLVEPSLITDEEGRASLDVDLADSITTWRVSGLANTAAGELGSSTEGILVFQPFFIDVNFPATLTLGDTITVPVAIYNYTEETRDVTVTVMDADWFTLATPSVQTVTVPGLSVTSVDCTITAQQVGWHSLQAQGTSGDEADAVRRTIEVMPSGEQKNQSQSDLLEGSGSGTVVQSTFHVPTAAVDEASELVVKVYPGMFSQAVEGLDSILRMPSGCFEQTSSATYPNVMVLQYLQATGQSTPEVELKAREYINLGYQRLLTYEVTGGGFSWFGQVPAHNVLTAYGLMEFADMAQVHPVDEAVITRTVSWLASGQQADGSFVPTDGGIAEGAINNYENNVLRTTAYITWALLEAGYDDTSTISGAVSYIRAHRDEAADAYTQAIVALALLADDPDSSAGLDMLDLLADGAIVEEGGAHFEGGDDPGLTYSTGDAHAIETTALAAEAFMRAGAHIDLAQQALTWLVRNKDSFGNWQTTQATIYSLRAMISAIAGSGTPADGTIAVTHNGTPVETLTITPEDYDVFRQVDLKEYVVEGDNQVSLTFTGTGSLMYQVASTHYLPWAGSSDPGDGPIGVQVDYDSTSLATDDLVEVTVELVNRTDANLMMVMLDLGVPPGFSVLTGDLDSLVAASMFSRYEMTGRQIIVYFEAIEPGTTTFTYRMRADNPIEAEAPASRIYLYYDPAVESFSEPIPIRVD